MQAKHRYIFSLATGERLGFDPVPKASSVPDKSGAVGAFDPKASLLWVLKLRLVLCRGGGGAEVPGFLGSCTKILLLHGVLPLGLVPAGVGTSHCMVVQRRNWRASAAQ